MRNIILLILMITNISFGQLSHRKQKLYDENRIDPVKASIFSIILPSSGYFYSKAPDMTNMLFYGMARAGSVYMIAKSIDYMDDSKDSRDKAPLLAGAGIGLYLLFSIYESMDVYHEAEKSNSRLYTNIEKFNEVSFNVVPYKNGAKIEAVIPLNNPSKR